MTGKIIPWVRSYSFLHLTSYKDLLHARSPSRVWPTGTEEDVEVSSLCKAHAHPVWVLFLFWVRFSILSLGEGSSYISCLPGSRCPSLSHWPKRLFPVPVVVPVRIFHRRRLGHRVPCIILRGFEHFNTYDSNQGKNLIWLFPVLWTESFEVRALIACMHSWRGKRD